MSRALHLTGKFQCLGDVVFLYAQIQNSVKTNIKCKVATHDSLHSPLSDVCCSGRWTLHYSLKYVLPKNILNETLSQFKMYESILVWADSYFQCRWGVMKVSSFHADMWMWLTSTCTACGKLFLSQTAVSNFVFGCKWKWVQAISR